MEHWLTVWIFAISTTITPGPNNIMLMSSGVNFGIKRSMPHLLGIVCGFVPMLLVIGLGMNEIFIQFPIIYQIIKVVGVFYLLYLAYLIGNASNISLQAGIANPISFVKAAAFQWLNPKAWVMATGAISTYTTLTSSFHWQVLYIAFVFMIIAFPCLFFWLIGGTQIKKYLAHSWQQKLFNVTMALLLVASIIPVIIELIERYI